MTGIVSTEQSIIDAGVIADVRAELDSLKAKPDLMKSEKVEESKSSDID